MADVTAEQVEKQQLIDAASAQYMEDMDKASTWREAEELTKRYEERMAELDPDYGRKGKHTERRGFSSWNVLNGGAAYSPISATQPLLPPGYYDIEVNQQGQVFFIPVKGRDDELIKFPKTVIGGVIDEIQRFWDSEGIFRRYGLPYKRGILLYGPPGSGKSCTLQMAARDVIDRGGIVVQFRNVGNFLAGLRVLRDVQPEIPVVVLMEDLDEILDKQNQSAILNMLDGVESVDRVVFLATTNYPRKLGERVYNRPSRFDRRFLVPNPDADTRRLYLEHVTQDYDDAHGPLDVQQMVEDTRNLSLAHVKELFVAVYLLGSDYKETVRMLQEMRDQSDFDEDGREVSPGTGAGGWL